MQIIYNNTIAQPLAKLVSENKPGTVIRVHHPGYDDHNKLVIIIDDDDIKRLLSLDEKFDVWGSSLHEYTGVVLPCKSITLS